MSIKRGIRAQHFQATNVLPDESEAQLLSRLKAPWKLDIPARSVSPFQIFWAFGSHDEREEFLIEPGESLTLRDSEAGTFARDLHEEGGVVFENPDDLNEVKTKSIAALRRVHSLLRDNGFSAVRRLMRTASPPRDFSSLSEFKYDYWPYIINEAKSLAISDEIKRLEKLSVQEEE